MKIRNTSFYSLKKQNSVGIQFIFNECIEQRREWRQGLKMNGQSSCEGEKSELGRGHLEGIGSSQEKTRHVKALCKGPQWMTSGVFNAYLGASDLF